MAVDKPRCSNNSLLLNENVIKKKKGKKNDGSMKIEENTLTE